MAKRPTKKGAGSRGREEETLDLSVTLDGETRPVTLSRMGPSVPVKFKTKIVTVACVSDSASER
jgi:hypothetical protein